MNAPDPMVTIVGWCLFVGFFVAAAIVVRVWRWAQRKRLQARFLRAYHRSRDVTLTPSRWQ